MTHNSTEKVWRIPLKVFVLKHLNSYCDAPMSDINIGICMVWWIRPGAISMSRYIICKSASMTMLTHLPLDKMDAI